MGSRYAPCLDMRMHLASRDIRSRCQINSRCILIPRSPSVAGVGGLVEVSMVISSTAGVLSSAKTGCTGSQTPLWQAPAALGGAPVAAPQDGDDKDFFLASSSREYSMKSFSIQLRTALATRNCHTRSLVVPALHTWSDAPISHSEEYEIGGGITNIQVNRPSR